MEVGCGLLDPVDELADQAAPSAARGGLLPSTCSNMARPGPPFVPEPDQRIAELLERDVKHHELCTAREATAVTPPQPWGPSENHDRIGVATERRRIGTIYLRREGSRLCFCVGRPAAMSPSFHVRK